MPDRHAVWEIVSGETEQSGKIANDAGITSTGATAMPG
jgi:hypothetical protein